jgi:hypothetical protein
VRQAVAEILGSERITQPSYPDAELGTIYNTESDAGLKHTVHVEIYGKWVGIAEASSDPDVRALLDDKERIELVKRLSDEASWPSEIRVSVTEDGRLAVSRTPVSGVAHFDND